MSDNITGFKTHRHKDNPLEQRLHDEFKKEFINQLGSVVYNPLPDHKISNTTITTHQKRVMLGVVQWFGSPVGQAFYKRVHAAHLAAIEKLKNKNQDGKKINE